MSWIICCILSRADACNTRHPLVIETVSLRMGLDSPIGVRSSSRTGSEGLWPSSEAVYHVGLMLGWGVHHVEVVAEGLYPPPLVLFRALLAEVAGGPHVQYGLRSCFATLHARRAGPSCARLGHGELAACQRWKVKRFEAEAIGVLAHSLRSMARNHHGCVEHPCRNTKITVNIDNVDAE